VKARFFHANQIPQAIRLARQTKFLLMRYNNMSPFKAAVIIGVTIGIVSFFGVKLLASRETGAEDDRLFI